jgi:hypothetical protein
VAGPGIRAGFDLTLIRGIDVDVQDTFSTACAVLGLTPPVPVDGRVVLEALEAPAPN